MSDFKHDPLLNELLSGEEAAAYRAASLEQMLAQARDRRRQRQTRRLAVLATVPALLVLVLVFTRPPAPVTQVAGNESPSTATATADVATAESAAAKDGATVRFISDDELLNLFPGRAVALIGPPGQQQFVFLDQKRRTPTANR